MVDTDDTRRTIHDGRRTPDNATVWHKLPTGELKTYGCVLLVFYWKHAKATLKKQRADTLGYWVCVKLLQPAKKRSSSYRFT